MTNNKLDKGVRITAETARLERTIPPPQPNVTLDDVLDRVTSHIQRTFKTGNTVHFQLTAHELDHMDSVVSSLEGLGYTVTRDERGFPSLVVSW